jgi:hypothetical protein
MCGRSACLNWLAQLIWTNTWPLLSIVALPALMVTAFVATRVL